MNIASVVELQEIYSNFSRLGEVGDAYSFLVWVFFFSNRSFSDRYILYGMYVPKISLITSSLFKLLRYNNGSSTEQCAVAVNEASTLL